MPVVGSAYGLASNAGRKLGQPGANGHAGIEEGFSRVKKKNLDQMLRGTGEVNMALIHDIEDASIENVPVVGFVVGEVNEGWKAPPQAESRMKFDRAFVFAKVCP